MALPLLAAAAPILGKTALATGASFGLSKLFGGNGDDISLTDQRTPEQIQAANILQQLATTGSGGGLTLGTPYTGSLGSFTPTTAEQTGLQQLMGSVGATNPALQQAQDVYSKFSQAAFDPSMLDPFKKAAYKEQGKAEDVLNREAAITGSRFGTGIQQRKTELAGDVQNTIQQQLANLFLGQQQVGLQGAAGLANVGGQQQVQQQQTLQNLFNFGQLERQLKNQEAQAKFNEFERQRGEQLGRLDLLSQEANRNPLLGISSIPGSPSGFSQLINSVLGGVGTGLGEGLGTSISKLFE